MTEIGSLLPEAPSPSQFIFLGTLIAGCGFVFFAFEVTSTATWLFATRQTSAGYSAAGLSLIIGGALLKMQSLVMS